jgi:hypothetical protein
VRALLVTPSHPEYLSGHSCGKRRFTAALEDVMAARIDAGIHFRTACNVGQSLGIKVADYIIDNALKPR